MSNKQSFELPTIKKGIGVPFNPVATLMFKSPEQLESWRKTFKAIPLSSDGLHLLDGNILELLVAPQESLPQSVYLR
jgi:hypothetical protein